MYCFKIWLNKNVSFKNSWRRADQFHRSRHLRVIWHLSRGHTEGCWLHVSSYQIQLNSAHSLVHAIWKCKIRVKYCLMFFRVRKILNLRVFEDENGRAWSRSVMDRDLEVLCVSQFTLQCILKGNKPDFHSAMPAEKAQPFYNNILEQLRRAYKPEHIKGEFKICRGIVPQYVHPKNDFLSCFLSP